MRWLAVCALVAGCIHDHLVPCGDNVCAVGSSCIAGVCATQEQIDVCAGHPDGDRCSTMASNGVCTNGVCISAVCGNGTTEAPEACDDGNQIGGDGCSALCDSGEVCGNAAVDYQLGEQCDEGVAGRSNDGCSSACRVEIDLWRDVSSQPPAMTFAAVAFDSSRERLVMFGGVDASGTVSNTTWEWDGVNWDEIETPTRPPPRIFTRLAYDKTRKRIVLFGGVGNNEQVFGDTWEYDGVTWVARTPATVPPARISPLFAYDEVRHELVMFGGRPSVLDIGLTDTWTWDGTNWTNRTSSYAPDADNGFSIAFDPVDGNVVGYSLQHTWIWDGAQWTEVVPSTQPPAWINPGLAGRSDGVILYGGSGDQTDPGSIWLWSGGNWQRILDTGPQTTEPELARWIDDKLVYVETSSPMVNILTGTSWSVVNALVRPGGASATTFDPRSGVAVRFADRSGIGRVWEWDGKDWLARAPTSTAFPADRSVSAMAYDDVDGEVYMIGGFIYLGPSGSIPTDEVWSWNARSLSWTKHADAGPGPLGLMSAVFRSATNSFLIVRGSSVGVTAPVQTWEFQPGVGFSQLTPAHAPVTSEGAPSLAYDSVRNRVVLCVDMRTWEWDGADWHDLTGSTPLVQTLRIGYDPIRERVIGIGETTPATFAWDGQSWQKLVPAISPPPRRQTSMFYDSVRHHLVNADGRDAQGDEWTAMWVYSFESGTPMELCAAEDTDGDGLIGCADPDCAGRCQSCGNAMCEPLENYLLCPVDCPAP